jgi:hypothetical protein
MQTSNSARAAYPPPKADGLCRPSVSHSVGKVTHDQANRIIASSSPDKRVVWDEKKEIKKKRKEKKRKREK